MATGRVLQIDQECGYGFIAAGDGGADVFLHAPVFGGDSYDLAPAGELNSRSWPATLEYAKKHGRVGI